MAIQYGGLDRLIKNNNKQGVINKMEEQDNVNTMSIPIDQIYIGQFKVYNIDEEELQELIEDISAAGLQQNLQVKETDIPNRYVVVTGHRRYTAIRYILDNNIEVSTLVRKSIEKPLCQVIPKTEDELLTFYRMHQTNIQHRSVFTLSEVEHYLNIVAEARAKGLMLNGKPIKGKSRELLMKQFGLSDGQAKKYIKVMKEGSDELKELIDAGEMSVNNAYDVLTGNAKPVFRTESDASDNGDSGDGQQGKDDKTAEKKKIVEEHIKNKKEWNLNMIRKANKKMMKNVSGFISTADEYETETGREFTPTIRDKMTLIMETVKELEVLLSELE